MSQARCHTTQHIWQSFQWGITCALLQQWLLQDFSLFSPGGSLCLEVKTNRWWLHVCWSRQMLVYNVARPAAWVSGCNNRGNSYCLIYLTHKSAAEDDGDGGSTCLIASVVTVTRCVSNTWIVQFFRCHFRLVQWVNEQHNPQNKCELRTLLRNPRQKFKVKKFPDVDTLHLFRLSLMLCLCSG